MHNQQLTAAAPDAGILALAQHPELIGGYLRTQWRRAFGLNVSQYDPLLYVGGQFRAHQWPQLYGLGIRAVLSLQAERADEFAGPQPAAALRLLVPDFHAPSIEQLAQAVAFTREAHAAGLPVFIHCHAGVGRAALTASAYLVARGHGHGEAFQLLRRARPIVALNPPQLRRLIEWEAHLRDGARMNADERG